MPPQFSCVPLRSTSENCAVLPCFSDFGCFPTAYFLTFPENWISRYRSEGASGLRENGNQAKCQYSWGVKRRVVGEYLSGQGSSMSIAEKYQLCSENRVLDWVKAYHDRTSRQETGGSVMRKDHTVEKRLRAVPACLDGGKVFEKLPWPTLKNYIT